MQRFSFLDSGSDKVKEPHLGCEAGATNVDCDIPVAPHHQPLLPPLHVDHLQLGPVLDAVEWEPGVGAPGARPVAENFSDCLYVRSVGGVSLLE